MEAKASGTELLTRARVLEKCGVPRSWSQFCGQVWAELDREQASIVKITEDEVRQCAAALGKERLAIVRAVAYLRIAAQKGAARKLLAGNNITPMEPES